MPRSVITKLLDEGTTPRITGLLVDEQENPLPSGTLGALTLTLYSISDPIYPIINGRNKQTVLNANGVTVDTSGAFAWATSAADLAILNAVLVIEERVALFEWTWGNGLKFGKQEIVLRVRNLLKVL